MKLTKIEPKFIKDHNPRIGLITLASDFRIEKDFNNVIYGKDIDLYCNRIHCYNPLTNEMLKKMADDIPKVTKEILPDQKLDCVAYGCTSGTIAAGYSSIVEKVNLDWEYLNNKSFSFDLKIFILTFLKVIKSKNISH